MTAFAPAPSDPARARVVFCTADVGCGHARAAAATMLAMRDLRPELRPVLVEAMALAPRWFGDLVTGFKLKPIVDVTNAPVKRPWPLNGSGKKQSGDTTVLPVTLEFEPYKKTTWNFPWNKPEAWAS